MPSLNNFPDELLLHIASYVRGPRIVKFVDDEPHSVEAYRYIKSLCLVSRRFGRIGQEALYRALRIYCGAEETSRANSLQTLVTTLLNSPDLAKLVKTLDIVVFMNRIEGHTWWCAGDLDRDVCECHWTEMHTIALSHLGTKSYRNHNWVVNIRNGSHEAWTGLLIDVLPNLDVLSISIDNQNRDPYGTYTPKHLRTSKWFGEPNIDVLKVPGFSHIKSIVTNCLVPWTIITLPSLRSLRFALQDGNIDIAPRHVLPPSIGEISNLRELTADISMRVLSATEESRIDIYDYFLNLVSRASRLEKVVVNLIWEVPDNNELPRMGWDNRYGNLIALIRNEHLSILEIYRAEECPSSISASDFVACDQYTFPILCCETGEIALPNLRRLKAPQNLFFDVNEDFIWSKLPLTLEILELHDATFAMRRWVGALLDDKKASMPPNLKQIITHGGKDRDDTRLEVLPPNSNDDETNEDEKEIMEELRKLRSIVQKNFSMSEEEYDELKERVRERGITWT